MSEQVVISKVNAQAAVGGVLFKLVVFSVLLGVFPIGSYFLSLKYLWNDNPTYAALTAAFAANVVLVSYIIVAVLEDKQATTPKSKKDPEETKKDK